MSWFSSLTFTGEDIEVQRGKIIFPRVQHWRGAKQRCKVRFLDLNSMQSLFSVSLTCNLGSLEILLHLAAKPECVGMQVLPSPCCYFDSFLFVQMFWVCLTSWPPLSRLFGPHPVIFMWMIFGYETRGSLDFFVSSTRIWMLLSNSRNRTQGI